ncbi:MAG: hypothetical protein ACRD0S_11680, partial [Acidimicrobiales bacterium]
MFAAVAAGAGRTGFLRVHRDDIGHAVVLHHGVNGVRALDPATSRRPIEVSSAADVRRLVQGATAVYAVVTDPTGAVIPDAFPPVVRSRSLFQALTDPPDTRLGSTGRGRGRGFTLGNALRRVDPGRSGRPSGTPSDDDYHPSDLTSLSSDGSVRGDDGDAMVVSDEETPPSGARRADTVADSSRPYRRPPREVPDDVVAWRPDGSPGGPATLREYLQRRGLPAGESLTPDRSGRLMPGVREWVWRWAVGLRGQTNPGTSRRYTLRDVADLSGGLATDKTVNEWWSVARNLQPPEDVVAWRPDGSPQGPGTLREHLERRGVPTGESLDTDALGRLAPGVREWVLNWALGLRGETDSAGTRYSPRLVAQLSGLVAQEVVQRWWS